MVLRKQIKSSNFEISNAIKVSDLFVTQKEEESITGAKHSFGVLAIEIVPDPSQDHFHTVFIPSINVRFLSNEIEESLEVARDCRSENALLFNIIDSNPSVADVHSTELRSCVDVVLLRIYLRENEP